MAKELVRMKGSTYIFSFLALFILADQLLLPVPRLFGISLFKPSYWILFSWPLFVMIYVHKGYVVSGAAHRFLKMTAPLLGIILCGLLGQLYLSTLGDIGNQNEALRATVFYLLMIFAFGFGQLIPYFRYKWILWLFYAIVALVLLLVFAIDRLPILAQLYFITPEKIEKISELVTFQGRYRGLSNPNSTMLLVNIVFLFLVVTYRLGYISRLPKFHIIFASTLNLVLCFIMASRNQMIVSVILALIFISAAIKKKKTYLFSLFVLVLGISILILLISSSAFRENYPFLENAFSRFATTDIFDITNKPVFETILRPFYQWQDFWDRFIESPIIGSGYSTLSVYPFDTLPEFHNDWFRVWATGGAIAGLLLFLWMIRIHKYFGLLVLLPFFLPGLTNTFLRNTPAVIVYCFLLGMLIEKNYRIKARNSEQVGSATSV